MYCPSPIDLPHNFNESFLRNLCLLYLKLQGQFLLPASTVQTIVEEMQNVHELVQDYTLSKLHSLLKNEMCLTDEVVSKVCDCVKNSDLFSFCHQGPLRTTYSRAQTFKQLFQYIEPKKVTLGNDENMTQRFAYYIPEKQHWVAYYNQNYGRIQHHNHLVKQSLWWSLQRFWWHKLWQKTKSNQFFLENP